MSPAESIAGPAESEGPSEGGGTSVELGANSAEVMAGGAEVGTWTIAPHWGQAARLPAALAATLSVRWQLVQVNSMEPAAWVGVVLIRLGEKVRSSRVACYSD